MYYDLYVKALSVLGHRNIDEYILSNDISSLFEKYDEDDVLLLRGIEGYVLGNYDNKKNLFNKVKKEIYNSFMENPRKYFDSFFFDERFTRQIFSFFEGRKIKRFMRGLDIQANDIMVRGPKDLDERHFLMKYLKKHIDLDNDYQKRYIREIMDKKVSEIDIEEYNFLCLYVGRWILRESGNEDIDLNIFVANFPDSRSDGGYAHDKYVIMRIFDDDFSVPYIVKCICHEVRHVIQSSMYDKLYVGDNKRVDSKIGLDYFEHLSMGDEYYHKNYWFSKIEYDAETNGIKYAEKFFSSFGKDFSDDLFDNGYFKFKPYEFRMQGICVKDRTDYEKEFAEYSDVCNMDLIVSSDVNLINIYPILHKLYGDDGKRLSFAEMMKNDFSLNDNLDIFYSFIFDYIQRGELDSYRADSIGFNNISLIFDRIYEKVMKMFSSSSQILLSMNDYSDGGNALSLSDLNDIFSSELVYYFSFLTKCSRYLNNYSDRFSIKDRDKFFSKIDGLLGKLDILFNESVLGFKEDNEAFLKRNYSELFQIYNNYRKDDIQKFFLDRLSKFVPEELYGLTIHGITLKDYVYDVLPLYVSHDDISCLDMDGKRIKFDDFIVDFIFKSFNYSDDDILVLLDLIRKPILEDEVRELFFEKYDEIAMMYKDNSSIFDVLKGSLKLASDEYDEKILSDMALDIDNEALASQIRSVISR